MNVVDESENCHSCMGKGLYTEYDDRIEFFKLFYL